MKKIDKLLESMNHEELKKLKIYLNTGHVSVAVQKKLERFKKDASVCPICNTAVGDEGLTLIFGPTDLKQKAHFDGIDCLEYFINNFRK